MRFFRQFNYYLRFEPENGMEVICYGQIKVYERSGQYQLYVNQVRPLGIGELRDRIPKAEGAAGRGRTF